MTFQSIPNAEEAPLLQADSTLRTANSDEKTSGSERSYNIEPSQDSLMRGCKSILVLAFVSWILLAPALVFWLLAPYFVLRDPQLSKGWHRGDIVWILPLVLVDFLTLAGYIWPMRELVRMASRRSYVSRLRVAITCFSMVAIAVVVYTPLAVWCLRH